MSIRRRNLCLAAALLATCNALGSLVLAEDNALTVPLYVPPAVTTPPAGPAAVTEQPVVEGYAPVDSTYVAAPGPVVGPVAVYPRSPWAAIAHQRLNYATPVPYDTGYFAFASTYYGKAYPNYTLYPRVRHSPFPYYYPSSRSTPSPAGPSTAALWPGYFYGYGYGSGYGYPYWPGADGTDPYPEGYNPFLH